MYFTTHALVGAAIGAKSGTMTGAVLGGLLSHLVLDTIPHHDATGPRGALIDIAVGALALFLLRHSMGSLAWWGAAAGTIPDLEVVLRYYGILHRSPWGFPSHNWSFLHHGWAPPGGVLIQAPFLLLAIAYLLRL
ncbi:MAG TPA: hypothetical protein GX513_09375 [Firmicutes bacterium]|nr:hypothetical protein [Bacillota bacterium]